MDLKRVVWSIGQNTPQQQFPEAVRTIDRDRFAQLGTTYISRLRAHGGDSSFHVVDKMPANFQLLGMLRAILPNAHVIHCRRDALDTCWSCYRNYFGGQQRFAQDLTELGRYYRLYEQLMAHWKQVLPGWILDIDYEALIDDQEGLTRQLLEFCGLEFDERCLQFHRTARVVKTASQYQVRRPLYKGSIGIWRRYANQLGPLIEALQSPATPLAAPKPGL